MSVTIIWEIREMQSEDSPRCQRHINRILIICSTLQDKYSPLAAEAGWGWGGTVETRMHYFGRCRLPRCRSRLWCLYLLSRHLRQVGEGGTQVGDVAHFRYGQLVLKRKRVAQNHDARVQHSVPCSCFPGDARYLCGFGQRVHSDQVDLQCPLLLHGQGQGQVAERIEGHRDLGAHGAHQGGLEKAVEDVHNDGVISLDVVLPRLLRHHLG